MSDGLDARRAAARAYDAVMQGEAALDAALAAAPGFAKLDTRDRGFALAVAATAIRRTGQTRAALDAYMKRPLPAALSYIDAILQTAAAQILFMGVAPYAAVSAAVDLARSTKAGGRHAGLVNAVLRRVAEGGAAAANAVPAEANLPDWLRTSWRAAYGEARLTAIAEALLGEPPLDLTLKDAAEAAARAAYIGGNVLPGGTVRRTGIGDVSAIAGYSEGAWWLQDAGAALPARLLAAKPGERVLDLCAAPGGKTMQLAAAGAHVTALDQSAKRLKRLESNLARTGLSADVIVADGRTWRPKTPFDAILLDAPCTATGTLRRRPDAAWLKSPADVAALAVLQDELAESAAMMLRPGGRMIVCTCSLQKEEGELWLDRLMAASPALSLDPVRPEEVPSLEGAILPSGAVRLTPEMWAGHGGIDGFFIARVVKG